MSIAATKWLKLDLSGRDPDHPQTYTGIGLFSNRL
jgi:hypothetical protein